MLINYFPVFCRSLQTYDTLLKTYSHLGDTQQISSSKVKCASSKPVQTHETPLNQIHIKELSLARFTYVCRETSQFDL